MNRKIARVEHWKALLVMGLAVLLTFLAVAANAYEPLTEDQAIAYMIRDPRGAVADIIALDLIQHTMPDVLQPQRVYSWKGRDLVVTYEPAYLDITVGPLCYRAFLEPDVVKGFKPAVGWVKPTLIGAGLAALIGGLIGYAVGK